MNDTIALYDAAKLHRISWPATPEGDYAKRILSAVDKERELTIISIIFMPTCKFYCVTNKFFR